MVSWCDVVGKGGEGKKGFCPVILMYKQILSPAASCENQGDKPASQSATTRTNYGGTFRSFDFSRFMLKQQLTLRARLERK